MGRVVPGRRGHTLGRRVSTEERQIAVLLVIVGVVAIAVLMAMVTGFFGQDNRKRPAESGRQEERRACLEAKLDWRDFRRHATSAR
jgi:hypothetical protein